MAWDLFNTVTIDHEDPSGLVRYTYECFLETLPCIIIARWVKVCYKRKSSQHKWVCGDRVSIGAAGVPDWVRKRAAKTLAGRVRRVVDDV